MTLTYLYDGAAVTHNVAPSTVRVTSAAELGEAAMSGLVIEDPDADLVMLGHRPFVIEDDACSQPRLFTGWTTERGIGRDVDAGLHGDATARSVDVSLVDLNALFSFRIISGEDGNRPSESVTAREAWLLGSDYLAGLVEDTGFVTGSVLTMEAVDYRGSYPSAVLSDVIARIEQASWEYNWFAFWDTDAAAVGLWLGVMDDAVSESTLRISNVLADVDGTTTFAPDPAAKLSVTPTETYSEVLVTYAQGTRRLFRSRASTATAHIRRGTVLDRPRAQNETVAAGHAESFLDHHATEQDRITVTIIVPASAGGLVVAGQRMDVKFSHLAGYTTWTSMRVVRCTANPTNDLATHYSLALELLAPRPAGASSEPVATHAALLRNTSDNPTYDWKVGSPWRAKFQATGDSPPAGWSVDALTGLVDYLTTTNSGGTFYSGFVVGGAGDVTVVYKYYLIGVNSPGITAEVMVNGSSVATEEITDFGTYVSGTLTFDPVAVVADDEVWVELSMDTGRFLPSSVGVDDCWMTIDGDLAAIAPDTETPLPPPPGVPVPSTSDPTAADSSYQPGQLWVNTATGETFVLSDNTPGAAVWTSVTAHGAYADLTDVDVTGIGDGDQMLWDAGTSTWLPAAPGGGTPSATVTDETAWDIAPDAGASTDYSRGDHTHGTPAEPVGGVADILDLPTAEMDDTLVLSPDGAGGVAWAAGGGGGSGALVLLEQHTASSSASLDFTTFISSTYDTYLVEMVGIVPATNAVSLYLEMGTGAGPTWDTTAAHYAHAAFRFIYNASGASGSESATWIIIDGGAGVDKLSSTAANGGLGGSLHLYNPNAGTLYPLIVGTTAFYSSAGRYDGATVRGSYLQTTAITGLRFIMSAGNIASGTIRIYGVAK